MSDTIDHFGGEGHDIDLAQEAMRRKRQDRENTESPEMKKEPPTGYREEMKKASQDLRFMQDCKDVMEDFSQADECKNTFSLRRVRLLMQTSGRCWQNRIYSWHTEASYWLGSQCQRRFDFA
jgi:hypothetical protein